MKTMNLPPYAPTLMESTRAIGYSLESALADIIDNSIAARSNKIDIDFFPVGEAYIAIHDDGTGMSEVEICKAMQYGNRNPNEVREVHDLGRYGLGLKTASLSQCRRLTVVTRKAGILSGCCWDLDHIQTAKKWSLQILSNNDMRLLPAFDKFKNQSSGTLVIWQNLDKLRLGEIDFSLSMGKKMDAVRQHISLVFHRYLSGEPGLGKKAIGINNMPVEPSDPFLSLKSTRIMDDETITVNGKKIIIRPYILPHLSNLSAPEIKMLGGKDGMRKLQGFYVYRNKRLLVWGTWFRIMRKGDLSKLARVQVDIPNSLDDLWSLDIKKSTATPPESVRKNLAAVINKITDGSKRTWTYRGKKEIAAGEQHLWDRLTTRDGGILYTINREHPLVEHVLQSGSKLKVALNSLLTQIERGIPLNQLYVDLNNDEKIDNDNEFSEKELVASLEQILLICSSDNEKNEMLERISHIEPFSAFPEVLITYKNKRMSYGNRK